jgi:kynurenine formamidase
MKLYNLSQPLTEDTAVFPGDPETEIKYFANLDPDGFNLSQSSFTNHVGTHIQTSHMVDQKGKKLSDYPLDSFTAPGVLIDLQNIGKDAVINETVLGTVSSQLSSLAIIFYTNYNQHLGKDDYFNHTPVLSKELIKMLLENKTKIIGIDSHSICKEPFDQYKMFAGHDTLLVEGLVNLDKVDGVEFTFVSVPVMTNAEAFPVTAYGLIKE